MNERKKLLVRLKRFWTILGPGLITGASDDDPSGIATYSQAGAAFGLRTLWTALLTFPLMASIQEMCARIGLVTSRGLTGTLKRHYPRGILYIMVLFSFPAIILNIGADIAGMGAVANLLFPGIHAGFFSVVFTIVLLVAIIYLPYLKIAAVLKYLCAFLLVYLIVPFLAHQDWPTVLQATFVPSFSSDANYIRILVAILGTTISPYLFFWQATMAVEELRHKKKRLIVDKRVIDSTRVDVNFGMFFSNLVMFFIILTTGTVLYNANIRQIDTVEQAAKALEPLAGPWAYWLFAIGVIGTGFLAIPVLCGSLSYIVSEVFGWEEGLDKKFHEARPFYLIVALSLILGLAIIEIGISPIQALIYTAILYGVTAPVIIAIVIHIANNRTVMGRFTNRLRSNILGGLALLLTTGAVVFMIVDFLAQ